MARTPKTPAFDPDDLFDKYRLYDQAVDVVSCYQWIFQNVTELAMTVRHFERYPRVSVGQKTYTPDFTVAFTDGDAMVGEVSRLARQPNSISSVCAQLQSYSTFVEIPDKPNRHGTRFAAAQTVDVALITHMKVSKAAADHILKERMDNPDDPFKPARRPVIIEFSQDQDAYVFRLYPEGNGTLSRGSRQDVYGDKDPFLCRPSDFDRYKVQFGFMNDNVAPLYMATRLWMRVFPTAFWDPDHNEVTIELPDLLAAVRDQHEGKGTASDVRQGMDVLVAAGLAKVVVAGKEWVVTRQSLRRSDKDVAKAIVDRIAKRARSNGASVPSLSSVPRHPRRGSTSPASGQDSLF